MTDEEYKEAVIELLLVAASSGSLVDATQALYGDDTDYTRHDKPVIDAAFRALANLRLADDYESDHNADDGYTEDLAETALRVHEGRLPI